MVRAVLRKAVATVLVACSVTGCGSHAAAPVDREWIANARGVVTQLRQDVVAVGGLDRAAAARRALHDDSQLYGLLVSYTDFGGCRHMVAALGTEPSQRAAAVRQLDRACSSLDTADALFTRAIARNDPLLLVRATTVALRSLTALDRAQLALHR